MKLRLLEFLENMLPKLFESIKFDSNGSAYIDDHFIIYTNLRHEKAVVSDYISNLKEVSDCDAIIYEFNKIEVLLKVVECKCTYLMNSGIIREEKKKEKQNNGTNAFNNNIYDNNISLLNDEKFRINILYRGCLNENTILRELANTKRRELLWKKGYVKGFYNNYCALF